MSDLVEHALRVAGFVAVGAIAINLCATFVALTLLGSADDVASKTAPHHTGHRS